MDEKIPPGHWLTITEALAVVTDVSRRRMQALAASKQVRSCKVLGRLLIDRDSLITWRDGPRKGGRPPLTPPPAPKKPRRT